MYRLVLCVLALAIEAWAENPSKDTNLSLCFKNQTISVRIKGADSSCSCETSRTSNPSIRTDYVHTPGIGSHKLHKHAKPWNEARKICNEENAHLAIINSREEEAILVDMLRKNREGIAWGLNKEEAYLGIHDLYKEGEWVTIFGESLSATGFAGWSPTYWGGQPDNRNNNQNCGALIYLGGLDDCDCRDPFAFFCELPLLCD